MYIFVESRIENPEHHDPAIWLLAHPRADPETRKNLIPNVASFVLAAAQAEDIQPVAAAAILSTLNNKYIAGAARENFMEVFGSEERIDELRFERIKMVTSAAMQGPLVEQTLDEVGRLRTISGDSFDWANREGHSCTVQNGKLRPYTEILTGEQRAKLGRPTLDPRINRRVLGYRLGWSNDRTPPTLPQVLHEEVLGRRDRAGRFHEIERRPEIL
jgi:hypothetical protein